MAIDWQSEKWWKAIKIKMKEILVKKFNNISQSDNNKIQDNIALNILKFLPSPRKTIKIE